MLKLFKRNVFRLQTFEHFVREDDAVSRQITLTSYYRLEEPIL